MASHGPRSALIVEVPAAEPVVARHRERLDSSARLGIPAHITVLYPLMPPDAIGPPVLAELERLFAAAGRFRFRLGRTAWFGQEVLWLAPDQPGRFAALTSRAGRAFPGFPPYGGRFEVVVPHLTVGEGHAADELRAAEESVRAGLPIDAEATAVTLMTQEAAGAHWVRTAAFPLAAGPVPAGDPAPAEDLVPAGDPVPEA